MRTISLKRRILLIALGAALIAADFAEGTELGS